MTLRKVFAASFFIAFVAAVLITGCHKSENNQPLEPISVLQPDSPIVSAFDTGMVPIQLKFTADKPLNYVIGFYDVDTLINDSTYVPTFADTLFYVNLQSLTPRINLYSWTGNYTVPGALVPFSVVRFKFMFTAGSNTGTAGQNYSVGIDTATKQIQINIL